MEWRPVRSLSRGIIAIGSFGGGSQNSFSSMNGNGMNNAAQGAMNQQGTFKPFSPTSVCFLRIAHE